MDALLAIDQLSPYGSQAETLNIQAQIERTSVDIESLGPRYRKERGRIQNTYSKSVHYGAHKLRLFQSERSVLSEDFPSPSTIGEVEFKTPRHFYEHAKAVMFHDWESAHEAIDARTRYLALVAGNSVKNYDADIWNTVSTKVMTYAVLHKYMQSAKCRHSLLQTGDDIIVQCSIFNKKWGCGLSIDHPDVGDPSKWQGENRYGKILTLVRNHLRTVDALIN